MLETTHGIFPHVGNLFTEMHRNVHQQFSTLDDLVCVQQMFMFCT